MLDWIRENNGAISIKRLVPPAFRKGFFLNFKGRYRAFKGARNTGKSHTIIGWEPLIKIISDPRRNVVVVRLNSNSNKDSTYANLCGRIIDLGLEKSFRMRENPTPEITYIPTGQKILFKGMNDPTTLNSLTFAVGFLTDVYIEEAYELESYSDFRKLDGSLRGKLPDGLNLQITLCFNAWSKESWIYDRFFRDVFEDDFAYLNDPNNSFQEYVDENWQGDYGKGLYLNTSTWKANTFRDAEATDPAAEAMAKRSPDIYAVEYLGMWGNSTATCYPEFNDSCVASLKDIRERYFFRSFALGVDTGLSNGEGGKRSVGRNQAVEERVKAAHALTLVGVTDDCESIVVLDEYFHTEIERNGAYNTDEAGQIGEPELLKRTADFVEAWIRKYSAVDIGVMSDYRQTINIYVDSADVGFRQMLQKEFDIRGMRNVFCYASSKLSVQTRVDFEKVLMAWGNFVVCDQCRNVIRELRNARRDPKGRARTDNDDHALTSMEYAFTPLLGDVHQWKNFKAR